MRSWFRTLGTALRDSLWFLPALFTLGAAAMAVILMALDAQGLFATGEAPWWIYRGSADGARSLLDTITGSLITVTGVVFSVTIVAVQLASSQYTPRVLRDFSSDRGNQVVFGIFIGTFTFAVLVLRTVRSSSAEEGEFIPRLAVTGALALLLVAVAALIYFINHLARQIHITALLDRIARETLDNVHQLFPEHIGRADDAPRPDPRDSETPSTLVGAEQAGYIQIVDEKSLFRIGEAAELVIAMQPKIGSFVLPGRPLASVSSAGPITEETKQAIRKAFVLGPERTPEQDVEFGIIQISDVAVKSLSPSINDPTTAIRCIDRLSEILAKLGTRAPPEPRRTRDGRVHFVASYTTFDDAIKLAYDEIRHFGASIPLVAEQLLHSFSELAVLVSEDHRKLLADQARAVLHTAREEITNPRDCAAVEQAAKRFAECAGSDIGA